jgi:hypothetical protein
MRYYLPSEYYKKMSKFIKIGDKIVPLEDVKYIEKDGHSLKVHWKKNPPGIVLPLHCFPEDGDTIDRLFAHTLRDLSGLPSKDHTKLLWSKKGPKTFRVMYNNFSNKYASNHVFEVREPTQGEDQRYYYFSKRQSLYTAELRPDVNYEKLLKMSCKIIHS